MKTEDRLQAILLLLSEVDYIRPEALAQQLRLSLRTIRTLIRQLQELVEGYGATIEHRRGLGIRLIISDSCLFQQLLHKRSCSPLPESGKQRIDFLLVLLFANSLSYIKADDICNHLFISRKTLSLSLKEVEQYLHKYQILLARKPYYGMKIVGNEQNFRLCLYDMLQTVEPLWLEAITSRFYSIDAVQNSIVKTIAACNYTLSETDIGKFVLQIQIMLYRIDMNCPICPDDSVQTFPFQKSDLEAAKQLALNLQIQTKKTIPDTELNYLALLLLSRKKTSITQHQVAIDPEIRHLTVRMLESIDHAFQINFREDFDLNTLLLQHMISLCARLKYRLRPENPLLEEIKENYGFAYAIAAHASTVLAEHFKTIVPEEEIGYLALCFALALKRRGSYCSKRNILLVCASGAGSAKFFEYRFREMFHDYIDQIYTCDIHALSKMDFSKIDHVFTTVPVPDFIPVPVCQVQYFFDKHNITDVERILKNKPRSGVANYFSRQLFFTDIVGDSREQILKSICHKISLVRNLPADFEDYVLKRESLMQTDLFPYVAIPHPYKPITEDTFVSVTILQKPVFWNMYDVQIIFLLSVSNRKENLEDFYHTATKFMMDEGFIKELIHKKDFDTLVRIIHEAEKK